jgi:hypothetical protein
MPCVRPVHRERQRHGRSREDRVLPYRHGGKASCAEIIVPIRIIELLAAACSPDRGYNAMGNLRWINAQDSACNLEKVRSLRARPVDRLHRLLASRGDVPCQQLSSIHSST